MKKKLSLLMLALLALTAVAATLARRAVSELSVVSEATVWNFADVTLGASYTSDFKLEGDAKNVENIYANFEDVTYASTFKADALAFTGEYPIRSNSKKFAQSGTLHFKTSVAGKIVVKFNDTGSSASATAVKRYLVVNGTQTEYWTSRENNGTEDPYAAQLNVTTGEIEVPAGDVTIAGSSAICVSYIKFTPNSTEPESNANQSYTLTFKDAGTDSDSPSDLSSEGSIDVSSILGADEAAYVSSVTNATKVYLGRTGHGLKLGTGSVTGTFTLNLATPVKPTSIVVKARKYNNNQNTIKINGNDFTLNDETSDDCTVQYDGNTEVSSIAIEAGNLRAYVLSVTVNYQEAGGEEPQPVADIIYDFAAEQALIAAGTVEKPGNFNGNQNNGQGFNAYSVKIRNDYKGYVKKEGSTLPETCNIWRRSDRFDQDASWNVAGGVNMPNNREFVIDGLTPGSKVVIEYDATNAAEGSKNIIWAVGENNKLGEAVGAGEGIPVTTATIGGVEAVPGETAIASGAEILIKSVTPAVKGTGYMVIQVKKNMLISKISILVNEDAVSNAVTVADGIENGTVKVNRTTAYEGDDVYVTATPAEGYELEAITVKDADGADVTVTDGKFTMPAKAVTVTVTFKQAGITLWSSETAVEANWGSNISIDKEKFANAKVGDIVHVAVEGVAAGSAWNAQVVLKAGNYSDIEGGVPVGDGSVTDATFVLTGDMLQYVKTYGMFVAGAGFSSKLVTLEYADEVAGSENSIWVGNATASVTVHANHFKCANEFSGVKAGDIIRITSTGEPEWIILQYSGADTGWEWTLYDGAVFTKTETGYDVKVTESMVTQMNTDGIIINHADGITISQVELIAAPEAPKFYIIGLNGNWDRTNMIEMARNESGRYEYEFTTETQAFFAFADKQMTAEEAEADQDWSVFNSYRYSLGDGDVEYTQLGEIKSLVKGAANGTITLKPGTFKITVEPDFNAVTITGEFAPEPQPVTVDKLFIMGTGTPGEWNTTTEMTYNETAQAFEYTLEVPAGGAWFTFSDAEFDGNWDDFNANHRYALGAGDVDATIGETLPLVKVNGTLAIKTAGTYKISVAKDLSTVTITATGTGINGIAADKMKNAIIYTVSGQRVEKAQKGLYIIDGKKVVVK